MFFPKKTFLGALAVLGLIVLTASSAQAQKAAAAAPSFREYRLQAAYRAGIAQNYEVTEKTTVQRIHSDSSIRSYQREVLTYVTVRCIESMENISRLVVTADSIIYKFTTGPSVIDYDSQKDAAPKAFPDLNNYVGVLNRSYELTYSPYGEVTKVAGDQIDFWRDYLQTNSGDLDTLISTIWLQALSDENLLHVGDMQKQIVPGSKRAIDSSWRHNLRLRVDGVVYEGKARSTFKSYEGGIFTIATQDTLPARTRWPLHVFEIPDLVQAQEGQAVVNSTLQLSTTGVLNGIDANISASFRGQVGKEIFTQNVTSTQSWKLVRQFQW
ncbi:MAG: hypothetical protein FGM33_03705 [Candidatus Kapabacteria bacterium]|nr:hypothetical protein [Candidatus Kapabacteria bacterium]